MKTLGTTLATALFCASTLSAQPWNGTATGPEGELLQFQCTPTQAGISCDFIQVLMLRNATEEDLQERLDGIDELLAESQAEFAGEDGDQVCAGLAEMSSAFEMLLQGRVDEAASLMITAMEFWGSDFDTVEFEERTATADPRFLQEMQERMTVLRTLCEGPTAEGIEALIRFEHALDTRTCRPVIRMWEDSFVQVSEQVWGLSNSRPYGPCGAVRLDRFVCAYPNSQVCNFLSETRVLNPEGEILGGSCASLDDDVREFNIAAEPHYLDCDRIDF